MDKVLKKSRDSNYELLRIVSMFMILIVHADFFSFGSVTTDDLNDNIISSTARLSFEMLSIGAVNVFVMISGWFGIKASVRGFFNFAFQCIYFISGIYAIALLFGIAEFSPRTLFENIFVNCGWFIKAYIGLYLLSPLLNMFLEKADKQHIRNFIILFFLFEFVYGWIGNTSFISQGYGTLSFIGLYMLARYLKIQWGGVKRTIYGLYVFLFCAVANVALYIIFLKLFNGVVLDLCSYISPIVIVGCCGLMIFVRGIEMNTNHIVNFIARSSFAVFLLHGNNYVMIYIFKPSILWCYDKYNGLQCLIYIVFILSAFFITAIILDQPRKYLWNKFINN